MSFGQVCKRCGCTRLWSLQKGRKRCSRCRYTFTPVLIPGTRWKDKRMLRRILTDFLLGHSTNQILQRHTISKKRLLRLLLQIRLAMGHDIPAVFSGVVEVDETYLGGKRSNMRMIQKLKTPSTYGLGTSKQPVFGILCRGGQVWAECVPNVEAKALQPLIERRVQKGSIVCSDTWRGYTGIAFKGYVHRLIKHAERQYTDHAGGHINGLEGFWGYLKRRLAAKGGIRRNRLPLYLAEYVWRYNHRKMPLKKQVTCCESLLPTLLGVT